MHRWYIATVGSLFPGNTTAENADETWTISSAYTSARSLIIPGDVYEDTYLLCTAVPAVPAES